MVCRSLAMSVCAEITIAYNVLCAGAVAISDGSIFSDTSRSVFLTGPDCLGNESSISQCSRNQSLPCSAQGGVGVVCQGM